MKHLVLTACLALPLSAAAQDDGDLSEGFSLMEEGAKRLFRGLIDEVEPGLEQFAQEMGPALMEIMRTLDSVRYYDGPEILPNGDIIIRRRDDAPEYVPRDTPEPLIEDPDGPIDL